MVYGSLYDQPCYIVCIRSGCRPQRGYSAIGEERIVPAVGGFRESYTFTMMVSLTSSTPCWVSPPRGGTNDQWDFLRVVAWLIEEGALTAGDYLVIDNARVHKATASSPLINGLMTLHGVELRFLPAYSPELNPCELVFAQVKRELRCKPRVLEVFSQEVLRHFACVSTEQVTSFYRHCLMTPLTA